MARSQNTNQPLPPAPDFVPAVPQELCDRYDLLASNLTPLVRELADLLDELDRLDADSAAALCATFAGTDPDLEDEFVDQWQSLSGHNHVRGMLAVVGVFPR